MLSNQKIPKFQCKQSLFPSIPKIFSVLLSEGQKKYEYFTLSYMLRTVGDNKFCLKFPQAKLILTAYYSLRELGHCMKILNTG